MLAVAHIAGAVISVVAFGMGIVLLGVWESTRNQKAAAEEMSIALNIPVERLEAAENLSRIVQFAAARFSSDRFQNRLSDLCWWIQAAFKLAYLLPSSGIPSLIARQTLYMRGWCWQSRSSFGLFPWHSPFFANSSPGDFLAKLGRSGRTLLNS
jgi:hypothetical protein